MQFRFYIDRHNNQPHCWNRHQITKSLVKQSFLNIKGKEYMDGNAWVRQCTTPDGKTLEVVYKWHEKPTHVFIITAYLL